jgi:hypothetical protein
MQPMKSYLPAAILFLAVLSLTLSMLLNNQDSSKTRHSLDFAADSLAAKDQLSGKNTQPHENNKKQRHNAPPTKETKPVLQAPSNKAGTTALAHNNKAKILSDDEIKAKVLAGEPGFEVFASRLTSHKVKIEPKWAKGDDWIVETYYYQMQSAGDVWIGPALWRFRITAELSFRGQNCWQFIITRADDPSYPPSTIYITRHSYQLAGLETTVQQKGERRKLTYIPKENERSAAVQARYSIIPFDLPGFQSEATVIPAGLHKTPAFLARKAKMPKDDELLGYRKASYKILYKQPFDRTRVQQRWAANDMRWPVESRTKSSWSFRRPKK